MKVGITEPALWKLYTELNYSYFGSSIYIQRVRWGKFLQDAIREGITFGLYMHDMGEEATHRVNEIILNAYLLDRTLLELYPWMPEHVLFHEMCHAMLILNLHPARMGSYVVKDDHGPEFQKLVQLHPKHEWREKILRTKLYEPILTQIQADANEWLKDHPDAKLRPEMVVPCG